MKKTYFNWSSGKDSALALYKVLQNPDYNLDLLVTTINKDFDRVSMHGLRKELLFKQARIYRYQFKNNRISCGCYYGFVCRNHERSYGFFS